MLKYGVMEKKKEKKKKYGVMVDTLCQPEKLRSLTK